MVKKKKDSKEQVVHKKKAPKKNEAHKKKSHHIMSPGEVDLKKVPTFKLRTEHEIALDFAARIYKKFEKIIKSVVLFGSTVKQTAVAGSDIDVIVLVDDVSVRWDQELIAWYREELDNILSTTPYQKSLHINTVTLSTWWEDLMRGDPVVMNILRYGEAMLDFAGFFEPLKFLLLRGKIRSTPEAVYNCLERAPAHLDRSRNSELGSIEGLYWAMVDSAHAALMAEGVIPPSPEHIGVDLKEVFVNDGRLKMKYVLWYRDLLILHKKISHEEIRDLKGVEIDDWQVKAQEFVDVMVALVKQIVEKK